ncbi:hypothetical protein FRB90_004696 [Tulasnella sp. 427]|nr:hypothetical protein FRB90_004696 [Tulasnella sp. 427]
MRLRLLLPSLQEYFANASTIVQALENAGFRTSDDLMFGDTPEGVLSKLEATTISYAGLQDFLLQVAVASSAVGSSGDTVVEEEQNIEWAQVGGETGVLELDEMVGEAFRDYGVTEVSGGAASRLVLWLIVRHLARYGESSVLWIDTSYDFSVDQAALALQSIQFKVRRSISRMLPIFTQFQGVIGWCNRP